MTVVALERDFMGHCTQWYESCYKPATFASIYNINKMAVSRTMMMMMTSNKWGSFEPFEAWLLRLVTLTGLVVIVPYG